MSKLALRWGHSTASEPLLCPPVPPAPTAVLRTQFAPYVKEHDNYVSSIVQAENELLAPLAPFGRKLSQHAQQTQQDATFVDTIGNTQTNPVRHAVLLTVLCLRARICGAVLVQCSKSGCPKKIALLLLTTDCGPSSAVCEQTSVHQQSWMRDCLMETSCTAGDCII